MLSFDITDRNIRIIKGTESNGKIRISAAAEIELDEAVIVNGHVNDINRVAVMINQVLKSKNMPDKEAIVSISSNQTVFKELMIPPNPKESEFMKNVRQELQMQINVDDSYSVAYVIVGEPEQNENGEKMQKILATACPYEVVECYKRIFHMLGISLKSVMIGCNAITKVLLADVKTKAKMPLLAVQIDANFISLNLYEDSQLSFSRFASIDPEDYNNPEDYIFEAVEENIDRMLMFARSRGSEEIENVAFYGDLNASPNLYNRLIDKMNGDGLSVSQLNVPPQIHGYQNLEFAVYANAIGAMFKRNKATEHINLLETESAGGAAAKAKTDKSMGVALVAGLALSILAVAGAWGVLAGMDGAVKADDNRMKAYINSAETQAELKRHERLLGLRDTVDAYAGQVKNASEAYKSQPIITIETFEAINDAAIKIANDQGHNIPEDTTLLKGVEYSDQCMAFECEFTTGDQYSQRFPSALVEYLLTNESKRFSQIEYSSYSVEEFDFGEDVEVDPNEPKVYVVSFDLLIHLQPNEVPEVEEATAEADADAAAE